jgi:hypothetical protein
MYTYHVDVEICINIYIYKYKRGIGVFDVIKINCRKILTGILYSDIDVPILCAYK